MWAGRRVYENPLGTAAMIGAAGLGSALAPMLPAAYLASPLLTFGLPFAKNLAGQLIPIKSNRFTRGINRGTDLALSGMALASAASIPGYLLHGGVGALNALNMYRDTRRTRR
jgi:hypothetical protein